MILVSEILIGYEEALWPKKLVISQASQILTNDLQILVLPYSRLSIIRPGHFRLQEFEKKNP